MCAFSMWALPPAFSVKDGSPAVQKEERESVRAPTSCVQPAVRRTIQNVQSGQVLSPLLTLCVCLFFAGALDTIDDQMTAASDKYELQIAELKKKLLSGDLTDAEREQLEAEANQIAAKIDNHQERLEEGTKTSFARGLKAIMARLCRTDPPLSFSFFWGFFGPDCIDT